MCRSCRKRRATRALTVRSRVHELSKTSRRNSFVMCQPLKARTMTREFSNLDTTRRRELSSFAFSRRERNRRLARLFESLYIENLLQVLVRLIDCFASQKHQGPRVLCSKLFGGLRNIPFTTVLTSWPCYYDYVVFSSQFILGISCLRGQFRNFGGRTCGWLGRSYV